jgi:hypothetical protein
MPCFPELTGQQLSYVFRYSYTVGQSRCASGARFPWEFTQIGNCGSPLWTEEGWLVITHGVGAMRQYLGASLFDLDDPSKEIGRLKDPCFRHEKMNEKVMYPMSCILRFDYPQQQPYITLCRIGLPPLMGGGYGRVMDALKKSK